jgi:hypothetical protein
LLSHPTGKIASINGVECYVAIPTIEYPKDKAILFLPDVFGHKLINSQVCRRLWLSDDQALMTLSLSCLLMISLVTVSTCAFASLE